MAKTYDENREYCKSISDKLDLIVSGRLYKCPDCGELVDAYYTGQPCECGCAMDIDEWEEHTLTDLFCEAFDIEYRVDHDRTYRSCRIMVACGGPNVYIDTKSGCVELYWWNDFASYTMDSDTVTAIDEYVEDLWNTIW